MNFRISLAGDLGSGKSTVAKILSEKFNAEIISTGNMLRLIAERMGLTIKDLNVYIEKDPSYDRKIDDTLVEFDKKEGDFIFDSRMAWYFVPSATSFYLKVQPSVAAKRVFAANRSNEKYASEQEAYDCLYARRLSEAKRYLANYGQDIMDLDNYDCVIDTTCLSPEEVAERIIQFLQNKGL